MDRDERIKQLYGNRIVPNKAQKGKLMAKCVPERKQPKKALPAVSVPGLAKTLFPYQEEGVAFLESRNGRAILGDDMGLGKSAQSLAYLQLHKEMRPAVIICPSSLKLNWAKEIFTWMEQCKENPVYILSGRTKHQVEEVFINSSGRLFLNPCKMPKTGIFIINYDVVNDWLSELTKINPEIILSDESQYIKSGKAARTKAVSSLVKKTPQFIAITGTLIENRPAEAYTVINLVSPTMFPSEWKYKMQYCAPKHNGYGWDFKGASNTAELNIRLQEIMIRRLKVDVLKDLPPKIRTVIPIEIDNKAEYRRAEQDLIAWLKDNKGAKKAEQASKIEALARINELKQLCVKGKMEACLNWIEDYLESGNKLVVFTTHTWVLDYVYSEFKQWAVKVDGSITGAKRQDAVNEFQNNKKIKLFVGNLDAAGVGLTLTTASATCTLELSFVPTKHDQAEDRVHRIGQTAECVNAYYLLAQGSIEEEIAFLLDEKRKIVSAVLDGTDVEEMSLLGELMNKLKGGSYGTNSNTK